MSKKSKCRFIKGWIGFCKNEVTEGELYCEDHSKKKCFVCEEQAARDCDETSGALVCCVPLCDKHCCPMDHGGGSPSLNEQKLKKEQSK